MTDAPESGNTPTAGPFGRAAQIYRAAGWLGTLPLGREPGKKGPVPSGFTGHNGRYPDGGDIGTWLSSPLAAHNIGLRMPPGVIGLDIDAGYSKVENGKEVVKRGEVTLAELEARFGPLPPTWVSSARPAPSGIRFFRVPTELDGRPINWPGEAGKFIEIIQPGHRYAVVWPSTNPDADGAPYEWRLPTGEWNGLDSALVRFSDDPVPAIGELAELPDTWVRGLALDYDRAQKADVGTGVLGEWFAKVRDGEPCPNIHSVTTKGIAGLNAADGSRHETARDALAAVVRASGDGHRGGPAAVRALHFAFVEAVGETRANGGEWQRLLAGAVQLAIVANATPRQACSHDIPAASGFLPGEMLPDFSPPPIAAPFSVGGGAPRLDDDQARGMVDAAIADIEAMDRELRDDAVRRYAADLVRAGVPEPELQRAKNELTSQSGMSGVKLTEWAAIVTETRRRQKADAKAAAVALRHLEAQTRLAEVQNGGNLLPPPYAPMDVAEQLIPRLPAPARWWRGDFYLWDGTRYAPWAPEAVDNWLYLQTKEAQFDGGGDKGPQKWLPDESKIGKLSHALSRGLLYRPSDQDVDDMPHHVACSNGVYDVSTGQLLQHSPERFNLASVPFAYDPEAKAPLWEWFLNDVLPVDAQLLLQEWFGYMVSGRTDMEKILHMQGLPRSGKGTVATVLEHLLGGESAVASPSMPSLVGTFGEQPLIGKTMAIMSDINWSFREIVEAVEIVKKISGRDTRDVNRKNREVWHGKLGVRFVIMGNDLPKFTDASGALSYRMLHIQFPGTVQGREDTSVKDRLLSELPGILNWALAGLARLTANGRFTEPVSAAELAADVRRQQSPVQGFLDDTCARSAEAPPVPLDELFPVYRAWARQADIDRPMDRERFSGALVSAGLKVRRSMINGVRARRVHGIVPALTQIEGRGAVSEWAALLNPELRTTGETTLPPGFMPTA